ncbi:MAG: hypothetical protein ACJAVR_002665 [Paracoccaceae bacterium]|jgi:hypothetical protein
MTVLTRGFFAVLERVRSRFVNPQELWIIARLRWTGVAAHGDVQQNDTGSQLGVLRAAQWLSAASFPPSRCHLTAFSTAPAAVRCTMLTTCMRWRR